MAETYTYTWTQARLESIQDQFRYLMTFAELGDVLADKVEFGLDKKIISKVGVYGANSTNKRVVEVELSVDWSEHAKLTLAIPVIHSGLPGWQGKQAPEVRVAGGRFARVVKAEKLRVGWTVTFTSEIEANPTLRAKWEDYYKRSGMAPGWEGGAFEERSEDFLDLEELGVRIRRAKRQI